MRITQPQSGPADIDWGCGLARGLVLDALPYDRFRDRVRKVTPAATAGNVALSSTNQGAARTFSSSVLGFGDVELFSGAQMTFQIIEQPNTLTQVAGLINKRLGGATSNSFSIGYNYNGGNEFTIDIGNSGGTAVGTNYQFNRAVMSTTVPNNLLIVIDGQAGATQKVLLYRNGVPVPYLSSIVDTAFTSFANTSAPLELGRVNNAALYYAGRISLIRAWNRTLSTDEVKAASDNPWQIYEAPLRPILFTTSGGVTPAGPFDSTLGGAQLSASGAASNQGAFSSALAGSILASIGQVGGEPIGTFSSLLNGASLSSAGRLDFIGSMDATLAGAGMVATGTALDSGSFATGLAGLSMAASGVVATNASGTFASTMGSAVMTAYGYNGTPPVLAGLFQRAPKTPRHVQRFQ